MLSDRDIVNSYLSFLETKFVSKENIGFGWYRDLKNSNRVGNVATAQVVLAYTIANRPVPDNQRVFEGLLNHRFSNGSWPFVSNINDVGVVDSTSWVLLALLLSQSPYQQNNTCLENSFDWLCNAQNDDGGWGLIKGADSRVVSTTFAVRALIAAKSPTYQKAIQNALSYLLDSQHADSYWINASGKPCVGTTSHAIIALSEFLHGEGILSIDRAVCWLIENCELKTQAFWDHLPFNEEIEVTVGERPTRIFYEYPITPLAIRALRLSTLSRVKYSDIIEGYLSALKGNKVFCGTKTSKGHDTSYGIHDIVMSIIENNLKASNFVNSTNFELEKFKEDVNKAEFPQLFRVHRSNANDSNTINVLFFHGLGGHPINTWLNEESGFFLPIGLLTDDSPNMNIYTLGYDNSPSAWLGSAMSLENRTVNIIQLLENENLNVGKVVFVGHSFGGLLIKNVISTIHSSESQNAPIKSILNKIAGVCFIATPHSGSSLANFFKWLRLVFKNTPPIKDLEKNKEELLRLNERYKTLANDLKIKHISFAETRKTGSFWGGVLVVNEVSANLGYPGARVVTLDANHIETSKPKEKNSLLVKSIQQFLNQIIKPS